MNKTNKLVIEKMNELDWTISTCESMTGGAVCARMIQVEHASNSVLGSLVTYATESKVKIGMVDPEVIDEFGAVSIQCAREMANGCQTAFASDISISVTGNASVSNPMENKNGGMAYICIAFFDKIYDFKFTTNKIGRTEIIEECVDFCMDQLWNLIKNN